MLTCLFHLMKFMQAVVGVVHFQQQNDRKEMRRGVERDIERIAAKKATKVAEQDSQQK